MGNSFVNFTRRFKNLTRSQAPCVSEIALKQNGHHRGAIVLHLVNPTFDKDYSLRQMKHLRTLEGNKLK